MSRDFATELQQPFFLNQNRRRAPIFLLSMMMLATMATVLQAEQVTKLGPGQFQYAWSLKSGLFTVQAQETVRVMIHDVVEVPEGAAVLVRFLDRQGTTLSEVDGTVLPGDPLVARFINNDQNNQRKLMRLEIVIASVTPELSPVTTVEVERPGDLIIRQSSCVGPYYSEPVERQPVVFSCENFVAEDLTL